MRGKHIDMSTYNREEHKYLMEHDLITRICDTFLRKLRAFSGFAGC